MTKKKRKREKNQRVPRVYITTPGKNKIKSARGYYSQKNLAERLNKQVEYSIHPATLSAWFCGRHSMPASLCLPLYDLLKDEQQVHFLKDFADKKNAIHWIEYLHPLYGTAEILHAEKQHAKEKILIDPLIPFYERISRIYKNEDHRVKFDIIQTLETLICKYEDKQENKIIIPS